MQEAPDRPAEDADATRPGDQARTGPDERLLTLAYEELHRLANEYMRREREDHTLSPTALVNEAWLRLSGLAGVEVRDREHFLALSAQAMRRVLVDHARRKRSEKRGGQRERVEVETGILLARGTSEDVLAVDEALARLAELSPRQARVVELRFFAGLEFEEVARVLSLSLSTIEREWRVARAFLQATLRGQGPESGLAARGGPPIP